MSRIKTIPNRLPGRGIIIAGSAAAACTIALIAFAGAILPDSGLAVDFANQGARPSFAHWFGTDYLGRDMFIRTVKGLSRSLGIGALASAAAALIALTLGVSAAILGPKTDALVNYSINLCMSVPHMILLILISFALGGGSKGVVVAVAATHWPSLARIIRAEVLQLKNAEYVRISEKLGRTRSFIAFRHVIPHVIPQFITGLVLLFPHAILHEASLTFLGFGLSPHQPAIGVILSESMRFLSLGYWWLAVAPGLALVAIVYAVNSLGQTLANVLDPFTVQE